MHNPAETVEALEFPRSNITDGLVFMVESCCCETAGLENPSMCMRFLACSAWELQKGLASFEDPIESEVPGLMARCASALLLLPTPPTFDRAAGA